MIDFIRYNRYENYRTLSMNSINPVYFLVSFAFLA